MTERRFEESARRPSSRESSSRESSARTFEASTRSFAHDVPLLLSAPADCDGSLVVALHGMGQSAASFRRDAEAITPPRAALLVPQAPYPHEIRGDGGIRQGNAWYVYTGETDAFLRSMERTEAWLLGAVSDCVAARGLDARRAALVGFSQGGYLAGWVAVRHPEAFRALVVAGGRIKDESLAAAAPRASSLRVLHVHGARDEAVKPDAAEASVGRIRAMGVPAEFRSYDCAHSVLRHPDARRDVATFLATALEKRPG